MSSMLATPEAETVTKPGDRLADLIRMVQADYAEMPGLSVTVAQGQRLWSLDRQSCDHVFTALLDGGYLRRTSKDRFVRA